MDDNKKAVYYFMLELNEKQLQEVDPSNYALITTLKNQNKILKERIRTFENK